MFKNYFKIAIRNIFKNRTYSSINISGFSLGLACCILILLHVLNEISYDKYNSKFNRIFRVKYSLKLNGLTYNEASIPFPAAEALRNDYPEIENTVRIYKNTEPALLEYKNKRYLEENLFFADKSLFHIFDFKFIAGNPENVFNNPSSIILTKSAAEKFFGNSNPINKILKYENKSLLKVTGVIQDIPHNSHFKFDFIIPLDFQLNQWETENTLNGREKQWFWTGAWTYLLLKNPEASNDLNNKFHLFVNKYFPDRIKAGVKLSLQPLSDIHLYSDLDNEIAPNSSIIYVYIFSGIAFFILIIACINFINLTTAQSLKRIKEVGIRKTLGATKTNLINQIIVETIITVIISLIVSFGMVEFSLPYLNNLTGSYIALNFISLFDFLLFVLGVIIIVSLFSGIYPAYFISRFNPLKSLKNSRPQKNYLRKILVILQFSISISLMIGVLIIVQQLNYIQNKNLGFDKRNILCIKARTEINNKYKIFKEELLKNPSIKSVSSTSNIPGEGFYSYRFVPQGKSMENPAVLPMLNVDYDFLKTLSIKIKTGRNFSLEHPSDKATAFIINEAAQKELGWEKDPVGKKILLFAAGTNAIEKTGKVIGVIENVIYESLHKTIKPVVLTLGGYTEYYMVKFRQGDLNKTIKYIDQKWNEFAPEWPIEYSFLDMNLKNNYEGEANLQKIINFFTLMAIIIACLGLFGLTTFIVEQRTKEIGIRKVLGASITGIMFSVSKQFLIWVSLANIIAWPAAFYLMQKWLQSFAYRIEISWWIFIISGIISILIAILTISFKAIKAAFANPVKSLRYE